MKNMKNLTITALWCRGNTYILKRLLNKSSILIILFLMIALSPRTTAQSSKNQMVGQFLKSKIKINSTAQTIWNVLTDIHKLLKVRSFEYTGSKKIFKKIGDNAEILFQNNLGVLTLTLIHPFSELRFVWDSDDAFSLCHQRWVIKPSDKETLVILEERLVEFIEFDKNSTPENSENILNHKKLFNQALPRLKSICEANKFKNITLGE